MTREQELLKQNEMLRAIAIQAKRLLLSNEIKDDDNGLSIPEAARLAELIERFKNDHFEIEPNLKPLGKKAWYANSAEKGQYAGLLEILALQRL